MHKLHHYFYCVYCVWAYVLLSYGHLLSVGTYMATDYGPKPVLHGLSLQLVEFQSKIDHVLSKTALLLSQI